MTSPRTAARTVAPAGRLRAEITRQLRLVSAHRRSAEVLAVRASHTRDPRVAAMLDRLAGRRRTAADRSRQALLTLGALHARRPSA